MITTYQIQNVLRVYGNQLKKRSALTRESVTPAQQPSDLVDISIDARRRQMLNQMSSQLISKILPEDGQGVPQGGDEVPEKGFLHWPDPGLSGIMREEKP